MVVCTIRSFVATADGTEVVVSRSQTGGSDVARIDVSTGLVLATRATSVPAVLRSTASRRRVIEVACPANNLLPCEIALVDPVTLARGRSVSLSLQLPSASPMATGYRVEVGTGTGSSDLGSFPIGPGEPFTADDVPPGRYFVRLYARNFSGKGAASNEVAIDVP